MSKRFLGLFVPLLALSAFLALPALAQAEQVTLRTNGQPLGESDTISLSSGNFHLGFGMGALCNEVQLTESMVEGPAAWQVTGGYIRDSEAGSLCSTDSPNLKVEVTNAGGFGGEFVTDEEDAEKGTFGPSPVQFTLVYYSSSGGQWVPFSQCEYAGSLASSFFLEAPMEGENSLSMGGSLDFVDGSGGCPAAVYTSASFVVTSNGEAVEATTY